VAQLGARLDGIEEVVGSNPIGSTKTQANKHFRPSLLYQLGSLYQLTAEQASPSRRRECLKPDGYRFVEWYARQRAASAAVALATVQMHLQVRLHT
jgi:hypothetical protein